MRRPAGWYEPVAEEEISAMQARSALIALSAAFGVAAVLATVTTIRQVKTETSSLSEPAARMSHPQFMSSPRPKAIESRAHS
jgi:hypothetical protein